jgi:16S rRNA (cytosine967-C5)-methyltransferase
MREQLDRDPPVIAPARELAFAVLRETFEDGAHTERAYRAGAERLGLEGRERAQAQRLSYGAVQRRGTTDAAIERLAGRATNLVDPPVLAALRLGLYELLFADGTPDHAAVDQAVELVKGAGAAHAAGFANAVLRRAAREREGLIEALLGDDSTAEKAAVAHSAPLWLARLWWQELGPEAARSLLAACNRPAEVALRAADPEAALAKLRAGGVEAAAAGGEWPLASPGSIAIAGRTGPLLSELVASGELTPQSRGSAGAVEVLDPGPEDQVLDLCAGPGIKTGQIAERRGDRGQIVSVELDPARAEEIAGQCARLGLRSVTVFEGDAAELQMPAEFDRVLVDAPCSDLGALASRPDARWRKSPKGIARLVEVQDRVLRAAARAVGPGGALVYSTCTISRAEG